MRRQSNNQEIDAYIRVVKLELCFPHTSFPSTIPVQCTCYEVYMNVMFFIELLAQQLPTAAPVGVAVNVKSVRRTVMSVCSTDSGLT